MKTLAKRALAGAVGALIASGAFAQGQRYLVTIDPVDRPKGFEKVRLSKAALAGAAIEIWHNTAIDPDCTTHAPGATLTIVEPPKHGTATISDEPFYLAFPQANPRSACNTRKIPGHRAFYVAAAGFTGRDRMVLQGSSPEGRVRRITVDIDVR